MIFESVFLIRGGSSGNDWGGKLIFAIIGIVLCLYDYQKNEKRLDYFWIYLTGTIIWGIVEFLMQYVVCTRIIQEKYFFGYEVTEYVWFTIPIQAMAEAGAITVIGMFVGDRLINEETRNKTLIICTIILTYTMVSMFYQNGGINYNNVNVGSNVHSRRDMFNIWAIIGALVLIPPAIYWLATTDPESRKRGLYLIGVLLVWSIPWNIVQWLGGQRWIEVGTQNPDGSYSNLRRADPMLEFWAMVYNTVFEIALVYSPFYAIPCALGLIKNERAEIIAN